MFNRDYFVFLKWALAHAADLPRLSGLAQGVYEAAGIDEKWHAIKALGDAVVPILGDFPGLANQVEAMSELDSCALEASVCSAASSDLFDVVKLWQVLEPLLPLLLRLIARR